MKVKKIQFISIIFIIWRLFLFIPLYVGEKILPYRSGYTYTNIWYFIKPYWPISSPLLFPWANFDGVHYLAIAGNGYTNNGRFFPLYPLLIRTVSWVFGDGHLFGPVYFLSGFIIVNGFFLLSLIMLYSLIRLDYSEKIARWSIVFLLIFPASFFFVSLYTESLFLFLTVSAFYCARKKQWILVGICGLLLTLTRFVGICIFPVLLYEFFKYDKRRFRILPLLFIPFGTLGYGWYNTIKWGDFLYFLKAHTQLGNSRSATSIVLIPQTMIRYARILITLPLSQHEWQIALFEFCSLLFALAFLYIAWRKRVRLSYVIFAFLCFCVPAFSGTFSGLPRYIIIMFPLFIGLSLTKNSVVKIFYCIITILLLFILLMLFSRGYFIA